MVYFHRVNKNLNIPNVMSAVRLIATPVIFWLILYSTPGNYPWLFVTYIVAALMDFFDGYFARKLKLETELGKILDPLADKLMVLAILAALMMRGDFPVWIAAPVILRDLLILVASMVLYKSRNFVQPSLIIGKITFFMVCFLILLHIITLNHTLEGIEMVKSFFAVVTLVFIIWSFGEYYQVYKIIKKGEA